MNVKAFGRKKQRRVAAQLIEEALLLSVALVALSLLVGGIESILKESANFTAGIWNAISGAIRNTIHQQRMKGLFDGLHKSGVPFLYITMMTPMKTREDAENRPAFEFDLVVGTWVDGKEKSLEASFIELEQRANVLAATL